MKCPHCDREIPEALLHHHWAELGGRCKSEKKAKACAENLAKGRAKRWPKKCEISKEKKMDSVDFVPTHRIVHDGLEYRVMLSDGAAFTAEEWLAFTPADFEFDGIDWTFMGQPLNGTVENL